MSEKTNLTGFFCLFLMFFLFIGFYVITFWKLFEKSDKEGWKSLIPVYNILVFLEIIDRPWWWLLFVFIPLINIPFGIKMCFDCAKSFGKGDEWDFGFLLYFVPFVYFPILAFGDAKYKYPGITKTIE